MHHPSKMLIAGSSPAVPARAINSAVECLLYTEMVTGSNPVSPITPINNMDTDRYIKIREEFEELKRMIRDVSYQMQELRESIGGTPIATEKLPVSEPYVHPWWEYQRN